MRIFFWSADTSGCSWYRCEVPAAALRARGHEVMVSQVLPSEWLDADVIVGQRMAQPGTSELWQKMAKEGRSRLVYEIDDDLFNADKTNSTVSTFFGDPQTQANIRANAAAADLVIVTTEPLAEVMRAHNPNVAMLPNCAPAWLLELPSPAARELLTIGWAGGPTHQHDWEGIASEVSRFITRTPGSELHLMGPPRRDLWHLTPADQLPPGELVRRLTPQSLRFTPWQHSVPDYYRSMDFHVGLAPLQSSVFNRSKSAIRVLEYAALGIPCVASATGPYAEFVRHGETGFLANYAHEWPRYLRQLLEPATRQEIGAKARAQAAKHTIESNIELWTEALCGI